MLQTETVHHLAYVNGDLPGFLNHLEKSFIDRNEGAFIATVNPEIGYAAAKDKDYFKTVSSADFILPDGIGIVLTSRLINSRLKSRIAGYDVFINLLSLADRKKKRVFLYGAKQEVIQAVADRLSTEYPGIEPGRILTRLCQRQRRSCEANRGCQAGHGFCRSRISSSGKVYL